MFMKRQCCFTVEVRCPISHEFALSDFYLISPTMDKVLCNVILGHFHRRTAQPCSADYMHGQLAQQQNQNIN